MGPDIEWQVDSASGQQTIVKTTKLPPKGTRRKIAIILMVFLGIGLGVFYRALPDQPTRPAPTSIPPATPTPVATPTPQPETLGQAIQRDVNMLATSADAADSSLAFAANPPSVLYQHGPSVVAASPDPEYADWYRSLQSASGSWGINPSVSLYNISETGTLPSGVTWVNIAQYRNHDYFYQTRFYRQQGQRWVWTLPDPSFWSGKTNTMRSYPFTVIYPVEDESVIHQAADRFASTLTLLCSDLKCPVPRAGRQWMGTITLTLVIKPDAQPFQKVEEQAGYVTVTLPSPRVAGYYEDFTTAGDPLTMMSFDALLDPLIRLATGNYNRWSSDRGGELYLQAIMDWQRVRVKAGLGRSALLFKDPAAAVAFPAQFKGQSVAGLYARQLRGEDRVPLVSVWDWWRNGSLYGSLLDSAHTEAESAIAFIDERFGEDRVIPFLNALGSAQSSEQAFEKGLGMTFGDFNRQWLQWLGQG